MNIQLAAIEARESTIGHIFSDEYAFEIPPYQTGSSCSRQMKV
jgi:hypothetical protein